VCCIVRIQGTVERPAVVVHPSIVVDIVARARRSVKNTRWLPSLSTQLNSLKRLEIGDYKAFGIFLRSS